MKEIVLFFNQPVCVQDDLRGHQARFKGHWQVMMDGFCVGVFACSIAFACGEYDGIATR